MNQGRWQLGPGAVHLWSVKPVRDLTVPSLYRDLVLFSQSDIPLIAEAYRLRHLEEPDTVPSGQKFVSVTNNNNLQSNNKEQQYPLHAFPGSIPYSLLRSEIPKLYDGSKRYVFLYKGDGQRLLLMFARIRGRPVVFFQTRPGFFCLLPPLEGLPDDLFEGTKLDVELIYQPESQSRRLEIFDVHRSCGHIVGHYNYLKRLHIAHYLIQTLSKHYQASCCSSSCSSSSSSSSESMYSPLNNAGIEYSPRMPGYHQTTTPATTQVKEWMDALGIEQEFQSSTTTTTTTTTLPSRCCIEPEITFSLGLFTLVAKRAYGIREVPYLLRTLIPSFPAYAQEGLMAEPDEYPILPGPCPHRKKIKIGNKSNTVDFLGGYDASHKTVGLWIEAPARQTDGEFRTYVQGKYVVGWRDTFILLFHSFEVADETGLELVREDGTAPRQYKWGDLHGKILECRRSDDGKSWLPIRLRDKRKPNTLETCLRTIENMDLTYRDIFPFLDLDGPVPIVPPSQRAMQL